MMMKLISEELLPTPPIRTRPPNLPNLPTPSLTMWRKGAQWRLWRTNLDTVKSSVPHSSSINTSKWRLAWHGETNSSPTSRFIVRLAGWHMPASLLDSSTWKYQDSLAQTSSYFQRSSASHIWTVWQFLCAFHLKRRVLKVLQIPLKIPRFISIKPDSTYKLKYMSGNSRIFFNPRKKGHPLTKIPQRGNSTHKQTAIPF